MAVSPPNRRALRRPPLWIDNLHFMIPKPILGTGRKHLIPVDHHRAPGSVIGHAAHVLLRKQGHGLHAALFALGVGQNIVHLGVGTGDDVDGDELSHLLCCCGARVCSGFYSANVAPDHNGH